MLAHAACVSLLLPYVQCIGTSWYQLIKIKAYQCSEPNYEVQGS